MRTRSWIAPSGQTPPQKTRPKSQRERERQREEQHGRRRHRVSAARQRQRHVLDRADRADAAGAIEPEVGQREDREGEHSLAAPLLQRQPRGDGQRRGQNGDVRGVPPERARVRISRLRQLISRFEVRRRKARRGRGIAAAPTISQAATTKSIPADRVLMCSSIAPARVA